MLNKYLRNIFEKLSGIPNNQIWGKFEKLDPE